MDQQIQKKFHEMVFGIRQCHLKCPESNLALASWLVSSNHVVHIVADGNALERTSLRHTGQGDGVSFIEGQVLTAERAAREFTKLEQAFDHSVIIASLRLCSAEVTLRSSTHGPSTH
jgi:hypothetical protein